MTVKNIFLLFLLLASVKVFSETKKIASEKDFTPYLGHYKRIDSSESQGFLCFTQLQALDNKKNRVSQLTLSKCLLDEDAIKSYDYNLFSFEKVCTHSDSCFFEVLAKNNRNTKRDSFGGNDAQYYKRESKDSFGFIAETTIDNYPHPPILFSNSFYDFKNNSYTFSYSMKSVYSRNEVKTMFPEIERTYKFASHSDFLQITQFVTYKLKKVNQKQPFQKKD